MATYLWKKVPLRASGVSFFSISIEHVLMRSLQNLEIMSTSSYKQLMRNTENEEEDILSIPNESYQPLDVSNFQKMTERGSDFTIPPIEPFFDDYQWPFQNLENHADINIKQGWNTYLSATDNTNNGKEVIIAVIDTGIDYTHIDLKDAMWKNPGETCEFNLTHSCEDNGLDDDLNGFIDDVYGVDFSGENQEGDPMDTHGHGTHVAGIIYAKPNGGGEMGAGVTSYTNGKVMIFYTQQLFLLF